jgi:uncharacterized protein (DUF2384 family)
MKTKTGQKEETQLLDELPEELSDNEILSLVNTKDINWRYVNTIKEIAPFSDALISKWLDVSVKTFRTYKQPQNKLKNAIKERILLLLSLSSHGNKAFGSKKEFEMWINTDNFYFDNKSPNSFLTTVTGTRFVIDRLIAMEYGDNV